MQTQDQTNSRFQNPFLDLAGGWADLWVRNQIAPIDREPGDEPLASMQPYPLPNTSAGSNPGDRTPVEFDLQRPMNIGGLRASPLVILGAAAAIVAIYTLAKRKGK